jgi:hypothetical protein
MSEHASRAALALRYDGPVPPLAALPPDFDAPWPQQIANRKRWAWADVRDAGCAVLAARRAFARTGNMRHHREWIRLRGGLRRALRIWAAYRDMAAETALPC